MRFQLNSKLLSVASHHNIADEHGNLAYSVEGKFFSFGHNLAFKSADGKEVARIEQRLLNFLPTFDLLLGGKHFATITKKFSWLNKQFKLDVPGPNDYDIEGNFWNYEYTFERQGVIVANVSRKLFSMTGVYGVDIVKGEDEVAILATVIVIDICNRNDNHD